MNQESMLTRIFRNSEGVAFPRIVQIELTSFCNATCFFCAHSWSERPQKHLDGDLYKRMIDEIRSWEQNKSMKLGWLYLTGLGEPMMHPRWRELYSYTRGLPGAFTTNCSILKEEDIDFLLDLDFAEIAFSLDTLNPERHQKIRGFSVDRVAPKIQYVYQQAKKRTRNPRLIVSTTLTYDTLNDMLDIYKWLVPQIDGLKDAFWHIKQIGHFPDIKAPLQIMPPMNFIEKLNDILPKHPQVVAIQGESSLRPYCTLWFDRVTILSDGSAVPCCHQAHDHNRIGNVADMSLVELFNSGGWRISQEKFARRDGFNGWSEIPYCRDCR